MKSASGKEMRKHAENCGELASEAKDIPGRKRYQRMQAAWTSLANTQDWLDGKKKPDHADEPAERTEASHSD